MPRWLVILVGLLVPAPALACSLCAGLQNRQTLRQEAFQAKLVLYGTLANPRLDPAGNGLTDLHIEEVLKRDPFLGNQKVVELPRFVPFNPKEPPKFLVFCDIFNGKIDPYRGSPLRSKAVVNYLRGAMALDPGNRAAALLYFFDYLDDREPEVAADAYLEFARATDQEIAHIAPKLAPAKLRSLLQAPTTPPERLSLFGFLLGASGQEQDAVLLRRLVENPNEQTTPALGGLLCGYLQLRPQEGWELATAILRDDKRSFPQRYAVVQMLRFCHGAKPEATRREVLRSMELVLPQSDLADLVIEDLRRWQAWDLTVKVLAQYGKPGQAPILRRAIVRYALCCPVSEAVPFIAELRKQDAELVRDVEESLQFENK